MEYAIDKGGNYIHYSNAEKITSYKCPNCLERVFIRTGKNACFYHKPIRDRTPLQRICPEYHESISFEERVTNPLDALYINNGGIPLYLCSNGKEFELRAYFPTISKGSFNKLKGMGAKIHVNTKAYSKRDRKTYNIDNLNYYPVNTIEKWIYVECNSDIDELDVKRKWLWGIRGVDIENDLYHSNNEGGYRVALKADIKVGKTYRIMFDKYPPKIEGINFKYVGVIWLREKSAKKLISIYEMNIYCITDHSREFIEGKGYRLVEKSNELIPLWPPGVFIANEIFFNQQEAFFLHIKNSEKEKLYLTLRDDLLEINDIENNKYSILALQVKNRSIASSYGKKDKYDSEIKYSILYSDFLVRKQIIEPIIKISNITGKEIEFDKKNFKLPKDGRFYIESNVPFCAIVSNENYVISSSGSYFENVNYLSKLIINSKAFGIKIYKCKREKNEEKTKQSLDWELEYLRLYRCTLPVIKASSQHIRLLYLLSHNINEKNIQIYRLLETWIKTNAIPVSAVNYIEKILKYLGG